MSAIDNKYKAGADYALSRFGIKKTANIRFIMPQIAGAVLGREGGKFLAGKLLGAKNPLMGELLGTIVGTSIGQSAGSTWEDFQKQRQNQTMQHPMIDQTAQDIPPWALTLAQSGSPLLKQSNDAGLRNIFMELLMGPANAFHEGYKNNGAAGALKTGLGTMAGGLAGTGAGLLASKGLEAVVGRDMKPMGIPMSHILSGLGGVLGGSKALEYTL